MQVRYSFIQKLSFYLALILSGCDVSPQQDGAVEQAVEVNEDKLESASLEESATFIAHIFSANLMEIELGQMAMERGETEPVKNVGKLKVESHTQFNKQLHKLASKYSITLPNKMGSEDKKQLNKIADKTGKAFDQAYSEFMVESHEELVDYLEDFVEDTPPSEISTWARDWADVLRQHLALAKKNKKSIDYML